MATTSNSRNPQLALIVGASRGLGLAIAAELLSRGWNVIGTVRSGRETGLHHLARDYGDTLKIEELDINDPDQIADLRRRLEGYVMDLLFVNAGTTTAEEHVSIGDVSTEEFTRVMITNALAPMRVIEALEAGVSISGVIGVMSSGQGSIANNETGMREVYRASKAALNMLMRSFAARPSERRAMVAMAPGWIRTELGGSDAPFGIEETVPLIVDVLVSAPNTPGLRYLDRFGNTVPW